jgi:hypothetical protein
MKRPLTNQELLDRYIHAVKLMLPPDTMEDIAAEVRSNLESLAEDQAKDLGRELTLKELSALLKQHGHPALVASRYRDQPGRSLISPLLFPFYWFALRAVFALWLAIRLIVAVFTFQGTTPAGTILLLLGRDILVAAFIIASGVTLLFATWEYLDLRFRYSDRFKPESLSPVPPPPVRQPPRQLPAVQIVGGVALLIFYALALYSPWLFWVWGGRGVFSPSETLYAMRLPLWLLALLWTSQSWLGHTRFAAVEWRRYLCTAVIVAGLVVVLFLLRSGDLLVAGPRWDSTQAKSLKTLNQMFSGTLVLACIFSGLVCVHELRRFLRRLSNDRQTADSAC